MKYETTYKPDDTSLLCQLGVYEQYHPIVVGAAAQYKIDWPVVAGIGSRESHWGLALNPRGPHGTGDFRERKFPTQYRSGALPPDGGFGRGLLQIDFDAHEFARGDRWMDPQENIFYGCKVLAESISTIKRRCTTADGHVVVPGYDEEQLVRYGLAAYNAGPLAVLTAIRQGVNVDTVTTKDDYARDVLSRAGWFERALLVNA